MCSEKQGFPLDFPKEFEKTSEVLPLSNYGISTYEEFNKAEKKVQHYEWLKKADLTDQEIKLYEENEAGLLKDCKKIEADILKSKLQAINDKIQRLRDVERSSLKNEASSSRCNLFENLQSKPLNLYPEGHPMNEIKEIEESLFGHLKNEIIPITKRRKILRRLERKKQKILSKEHELIIPLISSQRVSKPGSLWDVKEAPVGTNKKKSKLAKEKCMIGPQKPTLYTIKDNKIVRLEPIKSEDDNLNGKEHIGRFQCQDIILPKNAAEEKLLEGTKMALDDIKKMERFKNYEPGIPSKVLYLKNINSSVTQEQLSNLFNRFVVDNKGPIDVRLLSGQMRGQAFVTFLDKNVAVRALEEINGTIMRGKPIIVQFGRNSNRIQDTNR